MLTEAPHSMCVLWKQIILLHTVLETHHSYTDNQKAKSDWQGLCTPQMAIYGEESERQTSEDDAYWQCETGSIYITPCTTCGRLMGANNRLFWENIHLLIPCVTSVCMFPLGYRGTQCVGTCLKECERMWRFIKALWPGWSALDPNKAGSSMITTLGQKVMSIWPT